MQYKLEQEKTKEYTFFRNLKKKAIDVVAELEQTIIDHEDMLASNDRLIDSRIKTIQNTINNSKFQLNYIRELTRSAQPWQLVFHAVRADSQGPSTGRKIRLHSTLSHILQRQMNDNEGRAYFHGDLDKERSLYSIFTAQGAELHYLAKSIKTTIPLNGFEWFMEEDQPLTLTWSQGSRARVQKTVSLPADPSIESSSETVDHTVEVESYLSEDQIAINTWQSFDHLIPFPNLIMHFSKEQLAHFHAAPKTNFRIHGAAGSGKTQWALLRPLVLSLGLDKDIDLPHLHVPKFAPLSVSSFLGLAQSPPLVASLKQLLSTYPEAPIANMKIYSWSEVQTSILSNLKQAGLHPEFDEVEQFELAEGHNNPIGKLSVAKLAMSFVNYKLYQSIHNDLYFISEFKDSLYKNYNDKIREIVPNLNLRRAKETAHFQDFNAFNRYFTTSRLKTIWKQSHAQLADLNRPTQLDYSYTNFGLWLAHHVLKFINMFPDSNSPVYNLELNNILRGFETRYFSNQTQSSTNDISSKNFDFGIFYLLNVQDLLGLTIFPQEISELKHIFMDEYQDFTDIQNEMIKAMKAPNCSMTKVGDPYQTIAAYDGAQAENSFEEISFNTNYRQTHHLGKFSTDFHMKFQGGEPIQLRDELDTDEYPFKIKTGKKKNFEDFVALIKRDLSNSHYLSSVLIVKTMEEAEVLKHHLDKNLKTKLMKSESNTMESLSHDTLYIATPRMTKGLEFDTAYVIGVNSYDIEHSPIDTNQLYVAFSRARLRLGVALQSFSLGSTSNSQALHKLSEFLNANLKKLT